MSGDDSTAQAMGCQRARELLLDAGRTRLGEPERASLDRHLAGCAACRHEAEAEGLLSSALAALPRAAAPAALQRSLLQLADAAASSGAAAGVASPPALATISPRARGEDAPPRTAEAGPPRTADAAPPPAAPRRRWWRALVAPALVAAAMLVAIPAYYERVVLPRRAADALVGEVVGDHLRLLAASHPLGVESGGMHQVKPWFAGRLDFAPPVAFAGDDEFPLVGGDVAYVHDRKAAQMVFKRRLHTISLLIFLADGLALPAGDEPLGAHRAAVRSVRGFQTVIWRDGELAYALASDLNRAELLQLAARLAR